jgi:CheY-like chemotaxis protein
MGTQGKTRLVAIVDDDDSMRSALHGLLQSADLPARAFASAEEFLNSGQQHQIACLIADIRMPGMSGLELQAQLNTQRCRIPIIFITAHGDEKMRTQSSFWQNHSTTRHCSRVFGRLWKVERGNRRVRCGAQGGPPWRLL